MQKMRKNKYLTQESILFIFKLISYFDIITKEIRNRFISMSQIKNQFNEEVLHKLLF